MQESNKSVAGRYEIRGRLGSGGMGSVYEAWDTVLQKEVALKLMLFAHGEERQLLRFQKEAQATARLRHENIVEVIDFAFTDTDEPYMVLEHIKGISLARLLEKKQRLSLEEAIPIFIQVCAALSHAHQANIVHRDLKPANILLTENSDGSSTVKIVDFGLAKEVNVEQDMTRTGVVMGSPPYMSPEQANCTEIDGRSDIYSLGCVMFKCLTGRPPFVGDSTFQTVMMHIKQPAPTIQETEATIDSPDSIEAVIKKTLEKDPDVRYQSPDLLKADLEKVLAEITEKHNLDSTIVDTEAEESLSSPLKKRPAWKHPAALAMSFLVFSLSAISIYNVLHGKKPIHSKSSYKDNFHELSHDADDLATLSEKKMDGVTWTRLQSLSAKPNTVKTELRKIPDATRLQLVHLDTESAPAIKSLPPGLVDLEIFESMIGDEALGFITPSKNLRSLEVRAHCFITGEGLEYLSADRFPNLTVLCFSNEDLSDDGFKSILAMQQLQSLKIRNCAEFSGKNLAILSRLPELRRLELSSLGNLDEKYLGGISACRLDYLSLNESKGITDKSVDLLIRLSPEKLIINSTGISAKGIERIRLACPQTSL